MKENEIDKFINKTIKVTFFDNDTRVGILNKVIEHKSIKNKTTFYHSVKNGYILNCSDCGVEFCKSHVKKISEAL